MTEVASRSSAAWRVLVTGAAGGIGRAICSALLGEAQVRGLPLAIATAGSRPSAALDDLLAVLSQGGAQAHAVYGDLADADACGRLVDEAARHLGGLDALVSNAGVVRAGPLASLELTDWERVFALDVRATWLLAKAAYPLLARSRGAVVAIATVSATHPFPGLGAYSPAKAALTMLCRQLAQEWAADGIRVNSVSPGLIRTPLTEPVYRDTELLRGREAAVPLGRIGTPQDVASAVAYLASPAASYVTGVDLRVDGGLADSVLGTVPGIPPSDRTR